MHKKLILGIMLFAFIGSVFSLKIIAPDSIILEKNKASYIKIAVDPEGFAKNISYAVINAEISPKITNAKSIFFTTLKAEFEKAGDYNIIIYIDYDKGNAVKTIKAKVFDSNLEESIAYEINKSQFLFYSKEEKDSFNVKIKNIGKAAFFYFDIQNKSCYLIKRDAIKYIDSNQEAIFNFEIDMNKDKNCSNTSIPLILKNNKGSKEKIADIFIVFKNTAVIKSKNTSKEVNTSKKDEKNKTKAFSLKNTTALFTLSNEKTALYVFIGVIFAFLIIFARRGGLFNNSIPVSKIKL